MEPKLINKMLTQCRVSTFDRAGRQSACDLVLQGEVNDHDRQSAEQGTCGKDTPLLVELTGREDLQADHQGIFVHIVEQDLGNDEVAVGANKGEDADHY